MLPDTPFNSKEFASLLPLHIELTKSGRNYNSLRQLPISVPSGSFCGPDGGAPTDRVYGYNFNGKLYIEKVLAPFSSGVPNGNPVFYINGAITGDPSGILPSPTMVQFIGIQINPNEILLDIKEPYVRLQ